jgi:hypothetical protein
MTAAMDSQVLADWYREETEHEIGKTVPKAVEYGAGDLAEIGRAMARIMGRAGVSEQDATEIGVFFYLYGKMARWEQAIKEGRRASDDTLFDIRVYAGMARRNRQVGGWPWASEDVSAPEPTPEAPVAEAKGTPIEGGTHFVVVTGNPGPQDVEAPLACVACGPLNGGAPYPRGEIADVATKHEREYNQALYTGRTM